MSDINIKRELRMRCIEAACRLHAADPNAATQPRADELAAQARAKVVASAERFANWVNA